MRIPCPISALPAIAAEVGKYAEVVFYTERSGAVLSISGQLAFRHDGAELHIEILQNPGHFPDAMVKGGIRQLIEELVRP